MLDFQLTPNLHEIEDWLGPDFEKQAKFALAKSLTQTAGGARKRLQGTLTVDFTIRSKWTAGSIKTTSARKSNLEATVGSVAPYMALQAEGGLKVGRTGNDVGVPVGARPTPMSRTTRAKFPSRMLKKKKTFIGTTKGGVVGVWRRKRKTRYPLVLLWILKPRVKVEPRWDFAGQVETYVKLEWPRRIEAALDAALKDPGR